MKLGIEMEFWVVDEQGRLRDGAPLVEAADPLEPEFIGPLVEIQTDPHEDEASLRRELQRRLHRVLRAADERDTELVPLGTPVTAASPPARTTRGELFERIYGDGVQSAKNCAGTHVHFDDEASIRQLNLLTALDPAIALVSSSPYYLGRREEFCSRAVAYRRKCGDPFQQFCDLWSYADDVEEWESRIKRAHETFCGLAEDDGVARDTVDEEFDPVDTVLNPVRLRPEKGTVEWRAPDSTLPEQLVELTFDVHSLLSQVPEKPLVTVEDPRECGVGADAVRIPTFEELTSLSDEAIEHGLESRRVRSYLERMGFDVDSYRPISQELSGPRTLREPDACRIRLLYAKALRSEVKTLADPAPQPRERPVLP